MVYNLLYLLHVGQELQANKFVESITNFLGKRRYNPKIYLDRMTVA